jgi:beta-glucosidase
VPPQNEYDVSKGYTYMYFKGVPLWAFGHGLSYTHFTYANLKVTPASSPSGAAQVSFDLKNTGDRAGSDVAQLYTHQQKSAEVQPIKSLRAFKRINLEPGATQHIEFQLPVAQLAYYNVSKHDFAVEPGTFDILVGSSSDDIRLRGTFLVGTKQHASN